MTWLIGIISLIGIIGLLLLAFQVGPGVFANGDDGNDAPTEAAATPTTDPVVVIDSTPQPTNTPEPTATIPVPIATAQPTQAVTSATPSPPPPTATATAPVAVVPSLVGLTETQAVAQIDDSWELAIVREPSSTVPGGGVIRQSPAAGVEIAPGDTVTIVVSQGVQSVSIPDVRGLDLDDAIEQLEDLGFVVAITEEASGTVDEDEVIRTSPTTEAVSGSTITLVVSSGDDDENQDVAVVPYVYAEPFQDGVEAMEEAGLMVNRVTPLSCDEILSFSPIFECDDFPDGGIVTSTLAWESTVPEGSPVDLTYYDASE